MQKQVELNWLLDLKLLLLHNCGIYFNRFIIIGHHALSVGICHLKNGHFSFTDTISVVKLNCSLSLSLAEGNRSCRRNAARKDSCVHFKWKRIPEKASLVFTRGLGRLKIVSGTHQKEQRYIKDLRIHLWSFMAIRLLCWNLSNFKWGAVSTCFLPLINSKRSVNMKNLNLNFSPKKLQTRPGSPQIMTNTTMK